MSTTTTDGPMTGQRLDLVRQLATQLRIDSIRCSTAAGSGHPTSSLSAADLMAVLLTGHLRYDWDQPELPKQRPSDLGTSPTSLRGKAGCIWRPCWTAQRRRSSGTRWQIICVPRS